MATKTGRPTKYKAEFAIQGEKLTAKGFIDKEIADFFCVTESTLYKWKLDHPIFSEALKSGKKHSDSKVVDALYNRALGYETKEFKIEESKQGQKTTVITKQVAGDVGAMCFWLKNRQPGEWREKQEIAHTLSDDFDELMKDAATVE